MIWYVPYAIISLLYLVGEQWTWEEESVVCKRSQLLLIGWQVVEEAREVHRRSVEPKPGPSGHHHCWGNKKLIKLYNILGGNITCVTSIPTLYLTRNCIRSTNSSSAFGLRLITCLSFSHTLFHRHRVKVSNWHPFCDKRLRSKRKC